jgi:hypothetical protein
VTDVNAQSANLESDLTLEPRVARRIGVAEYRSNRRDQAQLVENRRPTHITSVKNQLYSRQRVVNAWTNQSVRI